MESRLREGAQVMRQDQQSALSDSAHWRLGPGQARRLEIGPGPRVLQVASGRVWLTLTGAGAGREQDQWLLAGDAAALPAGAEVVLEAWGDEAGFDLLVPPQACGRPSAGAAKRGAEHWLQRLRTWARPAGGLARAYRTA